MKKALIFCNHRVPTAEPNAIRLINIALMLKQLGYDSVLFGAYSDTEKKGIERGVTYVEWSQTQGHGIRQHQDRKQEFNHHIEQVIKENSDVELIISALGANSISAHTYLCNYAKKHEIVFLHSLVEWYGLAHIGGVRRIHRFIHNEYVMRRINPKSRNIISISSYMANYYNKKGCSTIVIPTLVDMSEYQNITHMKNDRITIAYAGSPRRKDCIVNAIFALDRITAEERSRLRFHIYGASTEDLKNVGLTDDIINRIGDSFVVHGRIPYAEVKQHIASADYTILLRHNTVNANAGFSTKVGESMACGTPVIANMTSDLATYIKDGETGIVCETESVASCEDAYRRILQIPHEQYKKMRTNAKNIAQTCFNLETYIKSLEELIEGNV